MLAVVSLTPEAEVAVLAFTSLDFTSLDFKVRAFAVRMVHLDIFYYFC